MKGLNILCATTVAIFFYGTLGVHSRRYSSLDPSFLSKADIESYDVFSESLLVELENFSNKILDKLADRFAQKLGRSGLNLDSKDHVRKIFSFLEDDEVTAIEKALEKQEEAAEENKASAPAAPAAPQHKRTSGLRSFFSGVKRAAKSAGKEVLIHASKAVTTHALKETLPDIEKLFKDALNRLPLDTKIVLTPIFYNLWKGMFKRLKVPLPQGFTIKNLILDGLDEAGKKKAEQLLKGGKLLKLEDLEAFKRRRRSL
ncbi:signal peptide-containing protein [Theileria equi strain WA]|uniref:Signal peptide-containing protein n=1 Tax=Theileria equi strain WA TaxID=1537102 RepID=L0AZ64_THEEQ|nr:signal peptide-containing protein [Theileria equi strain WA]AFZ80850.1 signal peptide-containing protein [Theileria equi strain WA]|eukprot:XP_004830516.1 signal peptide-containing protein [Theileria equi strain WA]